MRSEAEAMREACKQVALRWRDASDEEYASWHDCDGIALEIASLPLPNPDPALEAKPFLLKPEVWSDILGAGLHDPDGWRRNARLGEKRMDEPITFSEFVGRMFESTQIRDPHSPFARLVDARQGRPDD